MDSLKSLFSNVETWPNWAKVAIGTAALAVPAVYFMWSGKKRKSPLKDDWKKDVVYVYQFPRVHYVPNLSPFCLKLETWLRMADIKYENVDCSWTVRSKEGMLPFIELNGKEYCDSSLIIRDLTTILKKSADNDLSHEEQGIARAFDQMMETNALWSYAYLRYTENIDTMFSEKVLGIKLPFFMSLAMPKWLVIRQAKSRAFYQGIGRHSREEIINIGLDDLRAVSKFLGSKDFLFGRHPTRADATVFSILAQILYLPIDLPHKDLMEKECKNLAEHTERMKKRFWPDWKEATVDRKLNTDWKSKQN